MEKKLLVSKCWCEDEEFEKEIIEKLEEFIDLHFSTMKDEITPIVDMYFTDEFKAVVKIGLSFDNYTWVNGLGEDTVQDVNMWLDEKGYQAFHIDGKFEGRWVYDCHTLSPIQNNETINGFDGQDLVYLLNDFVLTC